MSEWRPVWFYETAVRVRCEVAAAWRIAMERWCDDAEGTGKAMAMARSMTIMCVERQRACAPPFSALWLLRSFFETIPIILLFIYLFIYLMKKSPVEDE
jgi:hypothetical protein